MTKREYWAKMEEHLKLAEDGKQNVTRQFHAQMAMLYLNLYIHAPITNWGK